MLLLKDLLTMSTPLRLATIATISGLLFARPSLQQTYTACNPTAQAGCPADPALGTSINADFTKGASDQFTASGNPTYNSNGAAFTVAQHGDAPTLTSKWYIMFGKVEITMKTAPGTGVVSSAILQSDDLDEIDWEWLGGAGDQVQSNYFGKGQTTTYDRAAIHAVTNTQGQWHTYTIDWTETQIVWQIDGSTVRVLSASSANGQFPQTPCQFKIGSWAGGDPSNPPGTISWAGGDTNYAAGPFTMYVQSLAVTDYSTGTKYTYGDQSGAWNTIESTGGTVNGNAGSSQTDTSAPAITSTSSGNVEPFSGTHADCTTCTTPGAGSWTFSTMTTAAVTNTNYPGLPSGWTVSGSGKVIPPSAAPVRYSLVTSYDIRGFLTTATVPVGVSTGWDNRGLPTTVYPSNCPVSNVPFAAGAVLMASSFIASDAGGQVVTSSGGATVARTGPAGVITLAATTAASGTHSAGEKNGYGWTVCVCVVGLAMVFGMVLA
ncbi:transglycosylase [Friedmanniomyces endolithicus]|nr:transglycosylase [Friedmanniomyces endolithicus]KAK0770859.1 transglycosylase [Friedmanniomyces endolithicus]KAK0781143.1 transglycosylase [Friedmanniomyces endolithicus]KAK0797403.1 transglycosylase [Friedmanniomyces endolithicus]KAK0841729.1 transglycosylase [Friedmanniomyces endolithicus]